MIKKITEFQNDVYKILNSKYNFEKQKEVLGNKYPEMKLENGYFVLPGIVAVRIR